MRFLKTELTDVVLVEPDVFRDSRGLFLETHHQEKYAAGGIGVRFVQDNYSRSIRGTLRGLHYQRAHPQGKLVSVLEGAVFDVAVDIRRGSPTFGRWMGLELSAENGRQLYLPPGLAHGFCVLTETAGFYYKCTEFYAPADERGIIWNDPGLKIDWPFAAPLLSAKDSAYKTLAEIMPDDLPLYTRS